MCFSKLSGSFFFFFFFLFFYYFFSVRLLSDLRGHSFFSSPPRRPMTSDFEGIVWKFNQLLKQRQFEILQSHILPTFKKSTIQVTLTSTMKRYWGVWCTCEHVSSLSMFSLQICIQLMIIRSHVKLCSSCQSKEVQTPGCDMC